MKAIFLDWDSPENFSICDESGKVLMIHDSEFEFDDVIVVDGFLSPGFPYLCPSIYVRKLDSDGISKYFFESAINWIKISDRFPKDSANVWCFDRDMGLTLGSFYLNEWHSIVCDADGNREILYDVTHWMPLIEPTPPKNE